VADRTSDGRAFRMLTIIDEYTRECLSIDVARRLSSEDVLERLSDLFIRRGVPRYLRSDNGPEFTENRVHEWLERVEVQALFIEPGLFVLFAYFSENQQRCTNNSNHSRTQ